MGLFKKKEFSAAAHIRDTDFSTRAHKDWKKLLSIFIIVALIAVALDSYLFWNVRYGNMFASEPVTETDTLSLDQKMLENVVNFYEDRSAAFEMWTARPATEIDPSL